MKYFIIFAISTVIANILVGNVHYLSEAQITFFSIIVGLGISGLSVLYLPDLKFAKARTRKRKNTNDLSIAEIMEDIFG